MLILVKRKVENIYFPCFSTIFQPQLAALENFSLLIFNFHISSILSPMIIHRLSIDNPSIPHRFDGQAMEMRWRSDGDT